MASYVAETEPLLPQTKLQQRRWRKPHPSWLVPLVLVASLARGLTLAARVQIVTQLSCDVLHRASRATLDAPFYSTSSSVSSTANLDRCFANPAVQASTAQLQMILTVIAGGLTALTAGRWGQWGDKYGRTKAMSAALFGLVAAESIYGLVSLRHGHKLLILSPIIEGLFGSWPTLQANVNAYLSDTTPSGSTAKLFSRFMGILYIGLAVGPSIASLILGQTTSKGLTPLNFLPFISACSYAACLFFVLLVVPESLHPTDKPSGEQTSTLELSSENPTTSSTLLVLLRRLVSPVAALRPRRVGALHKDYTLTIIAVSYFIYLMSLALYQLKYLYVEHVFLWDAERLGYYISYMGSVRAISLLVLLPMWVYLFRPLPPRRGAEVSPRRELNFDLSLVRISVLLDFLSHGFVILSSQNSQTSFVLATTLTSLGSTSIPSYSSTVLGYVRYRAAQGELSDQEDVGVLFGSLAVLQSLGQTIIGPIVFGFVYSMTVSTSPKGVFVLACLCTGVALLLMCIAHPRKRVILVGSRRGANAGRERGRSVMTKDIVRV